MREMEQVAGGGGEKEGGGGEEEEEQGGGAYSGSTCSGEPAVRKARSRRNRVRRPWALIPIPLSVAMGEISPEPGDRR